MLSVCWGVVERVFQMTSTRTQHVEHSQDFTNAHVESWLRIWGIFIPSEQKTSLLVSELIDEDKKGKKRCGNTRAWIWRRSSKGCYNNIAKELMIEDTAGYKEMMRMNHGNFLIRWALCMHGLNMLSVAEQIYSTLLSHTWMITKQRKCWAVLSEKLDQFQIWLNKTQPLSTAWQMRSTCWAQRVKSLYSKQI